MSELGLLLVVFVLRCSIGSGGTTVDEKGSSPVLGTMR